MKKIIATDKAPAAIGPYSQAVEVNGTIYISGQIPVNPETGEMPNGIRDQAYQSLENIMAILDEAGLGADSIVKTTVLITDMSEFATINEVYAKFFDGDYPARACYEVVHLPKGARVEIEAIAVR